MTVNHRGFWELDGGHRAPDDLVCGTLPHGGGLDDRSPLSPRRLPPGFWSGSPRPRPRPLPVPPRGCRESPKGGNFFCPCVPPSRPPGPIGSTGSYPSGRGGGDNHRRWNPQTRPPGPSGQPLRHPSVPWSGEKRHRWTRPRRLPGSPFCDAASRRIPTCRSVR